MRQSSQSRSSRDRIHRGAPLPVEPALSTPLTKAKYARRPIPNQKALRIALLAAASGLVGLVVLSSSNALAGEDRVAILSEAIGLKQGLLLGAALGALVGGWLSLGGARRIAGFGGVLLAGLLLVAILRSLRPSAWILDTILKGFLGEDGAAYSPALLVFVLVLAWRPLARGVRNALYTILQRSSSHPPTISTDLDPSLQSES